MCNTDIHLEQSSKSEDKTSLHQNGRGQRRMVYSMTSFRKLQTRKAFALSGENACYSRLSSCGGINQLIDLIPFGNERSLITQAADMLANNYALKFGLSNQTEDPALFARWYCGVPSAVEITGLVTFTGTWGQLSQCRSYYGLEEAGVKGKKVVAKANFDHQYVDILRDGYCLLGHNRPEQRLPTLKAGPPGLSSFGLAIKEDDFTDIDRVVAEEVLKFTYGIDRPLECQETVARAIVSAQQTPLLTGDEVFQFIDQPANVDRWYFPTYAELKSRGLNPDFEGKGRVDMSERPDRIAIMVPGIYPGQKVRTMVGKKKDVAIYVEATTRSDPMSVSTRDLKLFTEKFEDQIEDLVVVGCIGYEVVPLREDHWQVFLLYIEMDQEEFQPAIPEEEMTLEVATAIYTDIHSHRFSYLYQSSLRIACEYRTNHGAALYQAITSSLSGYSSKGSKDREEARVKRELTKSTGPVVDLSAKQREEWKATKQVVSFPNAQTEAIVYPEEKKKLMLKYQPNRTRRAREEFEIPQHIRDAAAKAEEEQFTEADRAKEQRMRYLTAARKEDIELKRQYAELSAQYDPQALRSFGKSNIADQMKVIHARREKLKQMYPHMHVEKTRIKTNIPWKWETLFKKFGSYRIDELILRKDYEPRFMTTQDNLRKILRLQMHETTGKTFTQMCAVLTHHVMKTKLNTHRQAYHTEKSKNAADATMRRSVFDVICRKIGDVRDIHELIDFCDSNSRSGEFRPFVSAETRIQRGNRGVAVPKLQRTRKSKQKKQRN